MRIYKDYLPPANSLDRFVAASTAEMIVARIFPSQIIPEKLC